MRQDFEGGIYWDELAEIYCCSFSMLSTVPLAQFQNYNKQLKQVQNATKNSIL